MKGKMILKITAPLAVLFALVFSACSETKHTTSWEDERDTLEDSFHSSSSLLDRFEVGYSDSLKLGDTSKIFFELAQKDSNASLFCSEDFICIEELETSLNFYLGKLKAGSKITVHALTKNMERDTLRLKSESGVFLKALNSSWDETQKSNAYTNYLLPGRDSLVGNEFVVLQEDFYFVDLKAVFDSTAQMNIFVEVDTSYYNYIGDTPEKNELEMELQDTLRGIILIGKSPREINVRFGSATGYSITTGAQGKWIMNYALYEEAKDSSIFIKQETLHDSLQNDIYAGRDSLNREILLPLDSTNWKLVLKPLNIENYLSGPFATFEIINTSRKLSQGEYLAFPDSIARAGDIDSVKRERNNEARYYLRQEQYIWLADVKKGDTLDIRHTMKGYSASKAVREIMNDKGKVLGSIGTTEGSTFFIAKEDGPVYLHYLSACAIDDYSCGLADNDNYNEELFFFTQVSHYGSLNSIHFYNKNSSQSLDTLYVKEGEELVLSDLYFRTLPSNASTQMKWFMPCADLISHEENGYTTTPLFNIQAITCDETLNGEQEFSAIELKVKNETAGEFARLIAESIADPTKRDTLTIVVQ